MDSLLVDALQAHLNEIARGDLLTVNQDSLSEQEVKRRERAQRRIERAHKSLEDFLAWREVSAPFDLPKRGERKIFEAAGVEVGREVSTDGRWSGAQFLLIHISEMAPLLVPKIGGELLTRSDGALGQADAAQPTSKMTGPEKEGGDTP